jgi:hypothetical protein
MYPYERANDIFSLVVHLSSEDVQYFVQQATWNTISTVPLIVLVHTTTEGKTIALFFFGGRSRPMPPFLSRCEGEDDGTMRSRVSRFDSIRVSSAVIAVPWMSVTYFQ